MSLISLLTNARARSGVENCKKYFIRFGGKRTFSLIFVVCMVAGCSKEMAVQERFKAQGATQIFDDGRMLRPVPAHTVSQDEASAGLVRPSISLEAIKRGQTRYEIFCTPCHDRLGEGQGLVIKAGFPHPRSLGSKHARELTDQAIFDLISSGYETMAGYKNIIDPGDRWRIVSYVRALQEVDAGAELSHEKPAENPVPKRPFPAEKANK